MARIITYSHTGKQLAEFNALVTMSWKLNEYGKATWTMSTRDEKCKREYIEFGNRVMIETDKLPVWVGVIDTPREWASNGEVSITAYTAEYLLTWRRAPVDKKISGTCGAKFEELIKIAQAGGNMFLRVGEVWGAGKAVAETLKSESIYDAIKDLTDRMGNDWNVTPEIVNGELRFTANLYKRRGNVRDVVLQDGYNIKASSKVFIEQGNIANDIIVVGVGASSGSQKTANTIDEESIGLYDYRQATVNLPSEYEGTLSAGADQQLFELKQPRRTFDVSALDVGDLWQNLQVGDIYTINLGNVGFVSGGYGLQTNVRIIGMEYAEEACAVRLISDESRDE